MKKMKICISTWNYLEQYREQADLYRALEEIKRQGFGLELFLDWYADPQLLDKKNWPHLKRLCQNCVSLSLHSRLIHYFDLKLIKEEIDMCHYIGGDALVVHPRSIGIDVSMFDYSAPPALHSDPLNTALEVLSYAEAKNVLLALENGPFDLLKLVRGRVENHSCGGFLKICIDTGHANIHRNRDQSLLLQLFEEFQDEVIVVHLADNFGEEDEHNIPGDGNIDWSSVFLELARINFQGSLVLELNTPELPLGGKKGEEFLNALSSAGL